MQIAIHMICSRCEMHASVPVWKGMF